MYIYKYIYIYKWFEFGLLTTVNICGKLTWPLFIYIYIYIYESRSRCFPTYCYCQVTEETRLSEIDRTDSWGGHQSGFEWYSDNIQLRYPLVWDVIVSLALCSTNTVRCRYNGVIFLKFSQWTPIARLCGRCIRCLLCVWSLIYILPLSSQYRC